MSSPNNDFSNDSESLKSLFDMLKQVQSSISDLSLNLERQQTAKPNPPEVVTRSVISPCDDRQYVSLWQDLGGPKLCFFPDGGIHPVYFLKRLTRLLDDAGVPESARVGFALDCLEGSAKDWATYKEDSFHSFDEFVSAFRKRYWGHKEQLQLLRKIKGGKHKSGNKADYFLHLAHLSTYLTDRMDEKELIESLSYHFTDDIRKGIVLSGLETVEDVEEFLRKVEGTNTTQDGAVAEKGDENTVALDDTSNNYDIDFTEPKLAQKNQYRERELNRRTDQMDFRNRFGRN